MLQFVEIMFLVINFVWFAFSQWLIIIIFVGITWKVATFDTESNEECMKSKKVSIYFVKLNALVYFAFFVQDTDIA